MRKKSDEEKKVISYARKEQKEKEKWEKPVLEDVSGKVMAQPYIRFT